MSAILARFVGRVGHNGTVDIHNDAAFASALSPTDVQALWFVNNNGLVTGDGIVSYTWVSGAPSSDYEINASIVSGTPDASSSATGTWLSLGTSRQWSVTRNVNVEGQTVLNLSVQVRLAASGVVVDTASVSITAEVTT